MAGVRGLWRRLFSGIFVFYLEGGALFNRPCPISARDVFLHADGFFVDFVVDVGELVDWRDGFRVGDGPYGRYGGKG